MGAKRVSRENFPLVVNEQAELESSTVYIFSPTGKKHLLKNPYNSFHSNLPHTAIFYRPNCYDYDRLCEKYDLKTKTRSD